MKTRILATLCLLCITKILFSQNDKMPTPQWRPAYHFTPEKNWTNDPNGIIYLDGVYHLYNQQNPYENKWGHMSWGHATSTDLVHWKHLPIAIPETIDRDTTWRFSGCAVLDEKNTSGFCTNGPCLVAIYTADQPNLKKESQFVAYSHDGGMSYINYAGNPVIDLHKRDFRDPNVTWSEQLGKWLMVVALPRDHAVRFYSSSNLKDWDMVSEFGAAGYANAGWECPSLLELPVEGNSHEKKWVLFVSAGGRERGPFMQYFVGDFDGKTFKNDNPADKILTVDEGDCFYAAIPWNNLPGDRKILIGWMVPGPQETYPWRGQMSIPRDLSLRKTSEGLRLVQQPSAVIAKNLGKLSGDRIIRKTDIVTSDGERVLENMKGNAYWLDAVLTASEGVDFGFKIGQKKGTEGQSISETIVGFDGKNNQWYVDRSKCGSEKLNRNKIKQTVQLPNSGKTTHIQILFDRSSLEVFLGDGEKVLSTYIFPAPDADGLSFYSRGGSTTINSLSVYDLSAASTP